MQSLSSRIRRYLLPAAGAVLVLCANGFSDVAVEAVIPFRVNVDAVVKISPPDGLGLTGASGVTANVSGGKDTALTLVLAGGTSTARRGGQARGAALTAVSYSRGNVSLKLSPQSFKDADVSLYTIAGKQVLRGRADASNTAQRLTRGNAAAGVYLLSVKGADGQTFAARLTHTGGRLSVNIGFDAGTAAASRTVALTPPDYGFWSVVVSAAGSGYKESSYTFAPVAGDNTKHGIELVEVGGDGELPEHLNPDIEYGSFIDTRDGANNRKYYTVTIGEQTWMAENLDYAGEDGNLGWCYNDEPDSCVKYGRLYDWATVMGFASSCNSSSCADQVQSPHQGICPTGWHVPSGVEWTAFKDAVDSPAGTKLKSASYWQSYSGIPTGTNDYGFSALPGGYRRKDGNFSHASNDGCWWKVTEQDANGARNWSILHLDEHMYGINDLKSRGFSLRCVMDAP